MPEILRLLKDQFETPIGEMVIVVDHDGNLRAVDWATMRTACFIF